MDLTRFFQILLFTVLSHVVFQTASASDLSIDLNRQQQLMHLLLADCGSCHGMTLKGGLGPALTQQALEKKTDELLFVSIKNGRPGTPMPPWQPFLKDHEINWLINVLRNETWRTKK